MKLLRNMLWLNIVINTQLAINKSSSTILKSSILCLFLFLCFTGMRETEGISCAYDAFQKKVINNNEVYTVRAYTTKLVGMKRVSALWVTSKT